MEKFLENLQEIQQAVDLLNDLFTIFDLDGMSFFCFPSKGVQNISCLAARFWDVSRLFGPKKNLKKFHLHKTIKCFKTPILGRFQQSSIISYRLKSWRLTTGSAPLLEPSLARTKSTLGSLVCVRKVNLALGQYEGIRYTCITVSLSSSHMSGNILTLIISSFKFQWF